MNFYGILGPTPPPPPPPPVCQSVTLCVNYVLNSWTPLFDILYNFSTPSSPYVNTYFLNNPKLLDRTQLISPKMGPPQNIKEWAIFLRMSQGTWHRPIELLVFEQSIQNATRPNDKCLEKSLLSPDETEKTRWAIILESHDSSNQDKIYWEERGATKTRLNYFVWP